jgi:4'-phosphopantetheinyl transferase
MPGNWRDIPAKRRRARPGQVDVWAVWLDEAPERLEALCASLSSDEQERAGRFHFEHDRRRFVRARGVLRQLLAEYLDVPPRDVTFSYGPSGKPALSGPSGGALTFNVSHSRELALMAIGGGMEIGVDVEAVRPMVEAAEIASRFFSARESAQLQALPEDVRNDAFFACWTRKEAYLKALGSGLAKPLGGFDVTFTPGEAAAVVVHGDPSETARWSLRALLPAPGYVGALATEGCAVTRCWQWAETGVAPARSLP